MSEIFILNVNEVYTEDSYKRLMEIMPEERKEKITRFHFEEDAKRALYASTLIRYILFLKYGQDPKDLQEEYNTFGKPFIKDREEWKYNLSHSGEWVICGFSNLPIGVDVEKIGKGNLDIAKHFFSEKEYAYLSNLEGEEDRKKMFYTIWTLKESYVKYKGKGLRIPLDSFSFVLDQEQVSIDSEEEKKLYFTNHELKNDYRLAVCTEEESAPILIMVKKDDLLHFVNQI